jgi:replicative DNA helicase
MSDLKESGNLEADGDYVVMIFRPFVYEKSKDYKPEDSQILLDKNKFGETGVIEMMFRGNVQRFEEVLSI